MSKVPEGGFNPSPYPPNSSGPNYPNYGSPPYYPQPAYAPPTAPPPTAPPTAPPAYGFPSEPPPYHSGGAAQMPPYAGPSPYGMQPVPASMPPQNYNRPAPSQPAPSQPYPQKQKKKGLFSGILDDVSRGLDSAARDIGGFAGKALVGDAMSILKTGNVVQFYYKKTGRTLQIVANPASGLLVVDAAGYLSPQAYNAHWFVYCETGSIIKLYNQDNYLAAVNGTLTVLKAQSPVMASQQTRWKVHQSASSDKVISLEAMYAPGFFLSVASNDTSVVLEKSSSLASNTYFTIQFVTSTINVRKVA